MNKALIAGLKRFWREEEGTEVVEWALVAGLLVAAGAGVWATIGGQVETLMEAVSTMLGEAE